MSGKIEKIENKLSRLHTKARKLLKRNQNVIYIMLAFHIRLMVALEFFFLSIVLRLLFREQKCSFFLLEQWNGS